MSAAAAETLRAVGVGVEFSGLKALSDVSVELRQGEILGLIGPNGAGKTTLVNVLSGFQRPTTGQVFLGSREVTGVPPHKLAVRGLGRTFQSVRLFGRMTVFENVLVGAVAGGLRSRAARETTWTLLERMGLAQAWELPAASLPHGAERRLGILRALAVRPRFLLLDEPAAGLNESETEGLLETLQLLPGRVRARAARDRARHGAHPAPVRPDPGARLRPHDRRGQPVRGAEGSARDRGVPRRRGRRRRRAGRCSRLTASPRATGA